MRSKTDELLMAMSSDTSDHDAVDVEAVPRPSEPASGCDEQQVLKPS